MGSLLEASSTPAPPSSWTGTFSRILHQALVFPPSSGPHNPHSSSSPHLFIPRVRTVSSCGLDLLNHLPEPEAFLPSPTDSIDSPNNTYSFFFFFALHLAFYCCWSTFPLSYITTRMITIVIFKPLCTRLYYLVHTRVLRQFVFSSLTCQYIPSSGLQPFMNLSKNIKNIKHVSSSSSQPGFTSVPQMVLQMFQSLSGPSLVFLPAPAWNWYSKIYILFLFTYLHLPHS